MEQIVEVRRTGDQVGWIDREMWV